MPRQPKIKINCADCPDKPRCHTLCAAAEAYANQDWRDKPHREIIMSDVAPGALDHRSVQAWQRQAAGG